MDSTQLVKIFDLVERERLSIHSLLIIRNGRTVLDAHFYPYDGQGLHDVASVTKSITSTLTGVAIREGKLPSELVPVKKLVSPTETVPADSWTANSTVADLLSMRSGISCDPDDEASNLRMRRSPDWQAEIFSRKASAPAGTRFQYCSAGMHALSAILTRVTSRPAADFASHALFAPLGIKEYIWPQDPQGNSFGWGDLHLSPVAMAKIGQMFLQFGKWNGAHIIPEMWVRRAASPLVPAGDGFYGYGWWAYPTVAGGLYEAEGRGGQRISVLPAQDMVVIMTGGGFEAGDVGGLILSSIKSQQPLPDDPKSFAQLASLVSKAAVPRTLFPVNRAPVSDTLRTELNGKRFQLAANDAGYLWVAFSFPTNQQARVNACFVDGSCSNVIVGLQGDELIGHEGRYGLTTVGSGYGEDEEFVFNVDEVENISAYSARVSVTTGGNLRLSLKFRSSGNAVILRGGLVDEASESIR